MNFTRLPAMAVMLALVVVNAPADADTIVSVGVDGTRFQVTLGSGRVLDSLSLRGAVLDVVVPGGTIQRIRIGDVTRDPDDPDGDVFLHRIFVSDAAGRWRELCEPDARGDRFAFPLRGQWDSDGRRISNDGLTLTCGSGAQGKCVRFGYKPWKTGPGGSALSEYHAACVKAVRADYCGDHPSTRDGQLIDIYDDLGIQRRDGSRTTEALPFEAGFSPSGAVCVAHTRVPERLTLGQLAAQCPRLVERTGTAACGEIDAVAGRFGRAMIFVRSPSPGTTLPPRRGDAPAAEPTGPASRATPSQEIR